MGESVVKRILFSIALLSLGAQAGADPAPQSNWYVIAGTSYTFGDGYGPEALGGRGGELGFGWSLGSGWMVNQNINFDFAITSKNLSVSGGEDIDQFGFEATGLYFFNRNSKMAPYILIGLGGVDDTRIQNQGFEAFVSAGFGFTSRLGDGPGAASLRVDARAIEELGDRSLNDAVVNLSLQIPVGSAN